MHTDDDRTPSMSPRENMATDLSVTSTSLTSLPVELLRDIMKYLEFPGCVYLSHVNAYLRAVAVQNPAPWSGFAIPIRRDTIDAVDRLVERTLPGRLLRVAIVDITPDDLVPICSFLTRHLGRIEALGLYFAPFDVERQDTYNGDMNSLWKAFDHTAAEHLVSLTLCAGHRPIHAIPDSIFNHAPPARLQTLLIEGFRLEDICPAFARIISVTLDLAALPNTPGAPSLGALFPGTHLISVTRCESYPVRGADGTLVPHDHLSQLPPLSPAHPVRQLHLTWAPRAPGMLDLAAARWVEAASPHVRFLSVLCPDYADVRGAALIRAGMHAGALAVLPTGGGGTAVRACVWPPNGDVSSAQIVVPSLGLGAVVASAAPYAPGAGTFVLSTARLGALAGAACARFNHLVLYIERENVRPDGLFVDPSGVGVPQIPQLTYVEVHAIAPVAVHAAALLAFVRHVAPNCTEFLKVSPRNVSVINPELLVKAFPQAMSYGKSK